MSAFVVPFVKASGLARFDERTSSTTLPKFTMRAMRFRPCIDLHEGRVKQIVGSTLKDDSAPETNFETNEKSSYFAKLYREDRLPGGHVIMLGDGNEAAAKEALMAYPNGLQVGGGITPKNAAKYLDFGASHVIVTSYIFQNGEVNWDRVVEMRDLVGKSNLVLDLSCRKLSNDKYIVCTNRWKFDTNVVIDEPNLLRLGSQCDELLVHAVDVEGKQAGMDEHLLQLLAKYSPVPVTYAGGVRSIGDLDEAKRLTSGVVDVTVGSALDIFGGNMKYKDAVQWQRGQEKLDVASIV